jgi:hypothetical protein
LSECEHNLPLTGKIGVHHTQHVLERFRHHKGLWLGGKGGERWLGCARDGGGQEKGEGAPA